MFFPPAFCIHFPLQKITRRTYVLGLIECVQLLTATSKLKMVLLCPESHACTVQFTVYISLEECLEWRSYTMLHWILETCLILFLTISLSRGVYGGEELC